MTDPVITLNPDRWLLCSPAVEAALRGPWSAGASPQSLMALRLRSGQVEYRSLDDARRRIRELAAAPGCGTLHLVVGTMDEAEVDQVIELENRADELGAEVVLHVWREAPLEVVRALSTPEDVVLQAWSHARAMPAAVRWAGTWPAGTAEAYRVALRDWAEAARAEYPEVMAETYDSVIEATTVAEVLKALRTAAAATAQVAAARVVRMLPRPPRPAAATEGAYSAANEDTEATSVRSWSFDEGLVLQAPLKDDGSDEATIVLWTDLAKAEAQRLGVISAKITKDTVVDFVGDDGDVRWVDDLQGGSVATAGVPWTDELVQALDDPDCTPELIFRPAPART